MNSNGEEIDEFEKSLSDRKAKVTMNEKKGSGINWTMALVVLGIGWFLVLQSGQLMGLISGFNRVQNGMDALGDGQSMINETLVGFGATLDKFGGTLTDLAQNVQKLTQTSENHEQRIRSLESKQSSSQTQSTFNSSGKSVVKEWRGEYSGNTGTFTEWSDGTVTFRGDM